MRRCARTSSGKRLSRIEGQVRGIARALEEDRNCIDAVTRISAARAALKRVEEVILKDHVGHRVERAIQSRDEHEPREKVAEFIEVLGRVRG